MYREIVNLIKNSQNIIVFTGAGISTNSGIPDFRGPDGLYSLVERNYDLPYPEAIFELHFFKKNPDPFYDLIKKMFFQNPGPTVCHDFITWLEKENKVSIIVTQNCDMLHHMSGSRNILECHGTFRTAHCLSCNKEFRLTDYKQTVLDGNTPHCECGGILKPDVVFFGEELPKDFYQLLNHHPRADMVLILGTSLNVLPTSEFALKVAEKVPSVIVNLKPTQYDDMITYALHEDLDVFAERVLNALKSK